ncbi:uncharacterized protein LOC112032871 [Quercus suber]|uniref:uncharacterized protein LOC112032871 n=1 Tax=Quercus suber TaxID=58331 RepID=UPI000CE1A2F4|nr:uncharacterized protein LOC112032871 [Quercus suber]
MGLVSCYIAMLEMEDHQQTPCIEEQQTIAESVEELEEVTLNELRPKRTTRMGTLASQPIRQALTAFLRINQDVFAWSHEDMPRIDPSAMVHKLNVNPASSLVQHKKRVFAQERDKAIAEEVRKLLKAGFIREVYYPDWLVNVVMVKKANGKWYGIPRVLVSDNGKQFGNNTFRDFCSELGIKNHYSSPTHPQANGQVKVTNWSLLKIIKTRLEGAKGIWPDELPSILWAYRTTVRTPTREIPF